VRRARQERKPRSIPAYTGRLLGQHDKRMTKAAIRDDGPYEGSDVQARHRMYRGYRKPRGSILPLAVLLIVIMAVTYLIMSR